MLVAVAFSMRALPSRLGGPEDQIAGIGCPECPGTLKVRVDGEHGHLRIECRIGHVFSLEELLLAEERNAENSLWAAVLRFEELAALMNDAAEHATSQGWPGRAPRCASRSRSASLVATALRALLDADEPIVVDWIRSSPASS